MRSLSSLINTELWTMKKFDAMIFKPGKLPMDALERMLGRFPGTDSRVVVGPRIGVDSAVLDFNDRYVLATTDPITFTPEEIGWYAVCVNSNDIAVMGGAPRWFFATLLLPEGKATGRQVRGIFDQLRRACGNAGVALCGGHTEITPAVNRPVICGTMLGEVKKGALVTPAGARPGDAILLTKGLGIEGTAILARECENRLKRQIPESVLKRAGRFLHKPGISVVLDAKIALQSGTVTAMHDPTEGGAATALRELALASEVGLRVRQDTLFVLKETRAICECLKIDPFGLISSGALLITCLRKSAERILSALSQNRIKASVIGEILPRNKGLLMESEGKTLPLPSFERDELARFFAGE